MTTEIRTIEVLDHGYVTLLDSMGDDLDIVRSARVSYRGDDKTGSELDKDFRLLAYLWRNNHTSPFEQVEFKFEVQAPIYVLRQWHRHRTWNYNEVSGRYTEVPDLFYVPDPDKIGVQSKSNRQSRDVSGQTVPAGLDGYEKMCQSMFNLYHRLLDEGWPRELARGVLPQATYSRMIAKVDLKNLLHFLSLRNHDHAQYEIQVYARAIEELIEPIVPEVMKLHRERT